VISSAEVTKLTLPKTLLIHYHLWIAIISDLSQLQHIDMRGSPSQPRHFLSLSTTLLTVTTLSSSALAIPPLDEVVMYEANIRAMSSNGDFAGVVERLDEIASLGVNTIWLMPVHPTGTINPYGPLGSPYSVRDHLAVSAEYGTLDDLRDLIAQAHARNISVILDWVANHTAWDHPWITQSPDWYSQDAGGNIIHPPGTNWLDVADLNYDNPVMRQAMIDQMIWWIHNTEIDGFRVDAADFVPDDFWAECVPALRASTSRPLLMLAEGARDEHHQSGFDLTFGWRFYTGLTDSFIYGSPATEIMNAHHDEHDGIPQGHSVLRWTTNHDETAHDEPPPILFGSLESSLAAYASMVINGATPLIYSGQEVGTSENTSFVANDPINWNLHSGLSNWFSWIIAIRQQHQSIRLGEHTDFNSNDALVLARTHNDERIAAWINTRPYSIAAPVPTSWVSSWTDFETQESKHLQGSRTLNPYEIRIAKLDSWPCFVVSGSLQSEQGDPSDWDPTQSSLIFNRTGSVYSIHAHNLLLDQSYDLEILTDRGLPPVLAQDPRIATGLRTYGDSDGSISINVDVNQTNNKDEPVVWIDTDAAPLQVVGNFMDEAGGNADWNPADIDFAMTPLSKGRYVFETTISTPGNYVFKTTLGTGWSHQIGTDGYNDNARVLAFETTTPCQLVRLYVDLRAQSLEALVNSCNADLNGDGVLNFFDVSNFLAAYTSGNPAADFTNDGELSFFDVSAFLTIFNDGC
jgi:glycosidase